jgi:hypothetical protein
VKAVVNDPYGVAVVGKYPSTLEAVTGSAIFCVLSGSDKDEVAVYGKARPVSFSCRACYAGGTCLVRNNTPRQWACSGVDDRGPLIQWLSQRALRLRPAT